MVLSITLMVFLLLSTSFCVSFLCLWRDVGHREFLVTGAKQPNYLVTADDVDTYLAIEVQPLDNRKRKVPSLNYWNSSPMYFSIVFPLSQ